MWRLRGECAAHFCRAGKRNLVDIGMSYECFARRAITGDDVHNASGQANFDTNFSERERGKGRKLRRL